MKNVERHHLLSIDRGDTTLRLCSNGLRWWVEAEQGDEAFRHELRAGSRAGITPVWDRTLADCARGTFTPRDDTLGTWWLIGHGAR